MNRTVKLILTAAEVLELLLNDKLAAGLHKALVLRLQLGDVLLERGVEGGHLRVGVAADTLSYVQSLNPSQLGLSGASMSEYRVVPMEGMQMLGDTCFSDICFHNNPHAFL